MVRSYSRGQRRRPERRWTPRILTAMTSSELALAGPRSPARRRQRCGPGRDPWQPTCTARDSRHRDPRCRSPPIGHAVPGRLPCRPGRPRTGRSGGPSRDRSRRASACSRERILATRDGAVEHCAARPESTARARSRIERPFHPSPLPWPSPSSPKSTRSSRTWSAARRTALGSSECCAATTARWSRSSMRSPARTAASAGTGRSCSAGSSRRWPRWPCANRSSTCRWAHRSGTSSRSSSAGAWSGHLPRWATGTTARPAGSTAGCPPTAS